MTMPVLKELLHGYIKSLFDEGVVNDQFNEILALKRIGEPDLVIKQIEKYFADAEKNLSEISHHVDDPNVDFNKLASLTREVEDKSTSIGAQKMKQACLDIIKTLDENPNNFSRDLPMLMSEFNKTKNKLKSLVQMERRIIRFETRSQSTTSSCSELANTSSESSN